MINDSPLSTESEEDEQPLSFDEIEAAYLRALQVAEVAESSVDVPEMAAAKSSPGIAGGGPLPPVNSSDGIRTDGAASRSDSTLTATIGSRISIEQVLEALLFVGGNPLPGRKLADILGCESALQVENLIARLSQRYESESRPYQIQLVEGGYEAVLKPEFDAIRSRVFGQGPKEVKLTQDALEVLAFIAYQQPVTLEQVLATEKPQAATLVRQLLRRELIVLQRGDGKGAESYRTTPRFLQLFGLASLDDLPLAVDFDFK